MSLNIWAPEIEKARSRWRAMMSRMVRSLVAARKRLALLLLKVLRQRGAAASATLVVGDICHVGGTHKKARTTAGNGKFCGGSLNLATASVVEVGGGVVFSCAPIHLNWAGMLWWIGDALFFPAELPSLGLHDMVNG